MKQVRALDHDGLDGILSTSDKLQSKPAGFRLLWLIPILMVVAVGGFWLKYQLRTPDTTSVAQQQSVSTVASEQIHSDEPEAALNASPADSRAPDAATAMAQAPENLQKPVVADATPVNDSLNAAPLANNNQAPSTPTPVSKPAQADINAKTLADALFTIHFHLDSSTPNPLSKTEINKLVDLASRCQSGIILIGHTCNLGDDATNTRLGMARANALKKLLTVNGIHAERIDVASAGMTKPVAPNANKSGKALNRRAELYCSER